MGVSCFAERCVVSARAVVPIPEDIPREVAAVLGCAVTTGVGAVLNRMPGVTGSDVLVIGAGGVGLSAVAGLRLAGAGRIAVADPVASRLELAGDFGATDLLDVSTTTLEQAACRRGLRPARWVLDTVGSPTTLMSALASVSPGGTLVVTGLNAVGALGTYPINRLVQQELQIVGSLYGSANPALLVPQLIDHYRHGRLPLDRLVGHTYGLDEVNQAFDGLRRGAVGRSVLVLS